MRRPHIRNVAVAVAVTTAATGLAGTAFAGPATGTGHTTSATAGASATSVVSAARAAAFAHASATGVSHGDELQAGDVMIDPEGARHVRFTRVHEGMPVLGGDLVVHLNEQLAYSGVTRAAGHTVKPAAATAAKLSAGQAEQKAATVAKGEAGTAELVVDARDGASALAYQVPVSGSDTAEAGGSRTVVIDAVTGKVRSNTPDNDEFLSPHLLDTLRERGEKLDPATGTGSQAAGLTAMSSAAAATRYPSTANGTGKSIFVGKVPLTTTRTARTTYLLKDPTRWGTETRDAKGQELESFSRGKKITTTNDVFGNGAVSNRNSAAADAQYGVTKTLDFYKKTFGRKGIKNNSKGAQAMVHFGKKVANAFWDSDCNCMLYGDGDGDMFKKPLVALDVTGHELTHGVVDATAKLEPTRVDRQGNQYGEPGALNESLADVFGSNVEFFTNNATDKPDYLIGEKMGLEQKFLRRLDHPSLDKLEGTIDYWSPQAYDAEVHAGSGVSSHAYYLLAEGSGRKTIGGVNYDSPTFDGSTVKGIGRTKATAIFYRALTRYMVSTTDFHDARVATLKAATDLYGANSTEYLTVDKAWAAVNVTPANTPAAHR
ncbi:MULTISPECIES: M4 family metallopeptidase [unclassified Streptomyces]|uniref:M4 family metallopeptidase n=1 Tax=unclassified Streptomyces TaxID=2593676 RepID=UPI002250A271|nr:MULTISPECIES: M4 family metallopeptidase [unclassified Streptomyces]MCX5055338.1 M4 family metallopeptidase [Streptomyces sp. NBC_00474]MCX5059842.1 M4 family metallopeptidase [Streptomyces sp. NBC_00452]